MRTLLASALLLFACGCSERRDDTTGQGAASAIASSGPDPIVLRIPRAGGTVRAYRYPRLDSLIWSSTSGVPPLESVLAFDQENGALVYLGQDGAPGWIDLRLGSVRRATRATVSRVASADGWSIYGVGDGNNVLRLTPSGDWTFPAGRKVSRVLPLPDGSLLLVADRNSNEAMLLRIRPPEDAVLDSVVIPQTALAASTPVGDRVYLAASRELLGVPSQDFTQLERLTLDANVAAMAPTPSGDRVYVSTDGESQIAVINRYTGDKVDDVELPGIAAKLRMDPLGRYLLVKPAKGDSAWVVAISTNQLLGTVPGVWREDLPFVSSDGAIATVRGADVVFVDGGTLKPQRTVAGGAKDYWHFVVWNGFRPRSAGLDQPVSFTRGDASAPLEATRQAAVPDSSPVPNQPVAPIETPRRDTVVRAAPVHNVWTVSFAALLSEEKARALAGSIRVDGHIARVTAGITGGTTIYRVVLGPYSSKSDADRIGRASGHSYWVYEGTP